MSILNSPLAKAGMAVMTGGASLLAQGSSPASKAFGAYQAGSNLADSFGSKTAPLKTSPDWSENNFGGQDYANQLGEQGSQFGAQFSPDDQLGAIKRRFSGSGGGGF